MVTSSGFSSEIHTGVPIIEDRLYFLCLSQCSNHSFKSNNDFHFFSTDKKLMYNNFNEDFGPLNLGCIYRFNHILSRKLKMKSLMNRKLIFYTIVTGIDGDQKRVNAAFLMGTFMLMNLNMKPDEACEVLECGEPFISFKDASFKTYDYGLSLLSCLKGFKKGLEHEFFSMKDFDVLEYEHFEKVDNGDFNWIIPNQILAFCSPHSNPSKQKGSMVHGPELYVEYFREHKVGAVIRLNETMYESNAFTKAGIRHFELFFPDGSVPSRAIVDKFIKICDDAVKENVGVAVHCKAGLGRTGTLIGCYMMKKFKMTAKETIAWVRIARPGSIIGPQQNFLERMEKKFLFKSRNSLENPKEQNSSIEMIDAKESPVCSSATDTEQVTRIEPATNLSHPSANVGESSKKILATSDVNTLQKSGASPKTHSHFLRSCRTKTWQYDASSENLTKHKSDAFQGDRLNSIKMKRFFKEKDARSNCVKTKTNLNLKSLSKLSINSLKLAAPKSMKESNVKKKNTDMKTSRMQQKLKNFNPPSGIEGNREIIPSLSSARVTRSSMRI